LMHLLQINEEIALMRLYPKVKITTFICLM